jgi:hypothetical protein
VVEDKGACGRVGQTGGNQLPAVEKGKEGEPVEIITFTDNEHVGEKALDFWLW